MYLAVDIETTGTDPDRHQILEVAFVFEQSEKDVVDCPAFHCYIYHNPIIGHPNALNLNRKLFKKIVEGGRTPKIFVDDFIAWLEFLGHPGEFVLVGKNVGQFDWQFLRRVEGFPTDLFSYRMLDIGSMHAACGVIPKLSEIEIDEDIPGKPHTALYDARYALAAARKAWF